MFKEVETMANPVQNLQRTAAEYKKMDQKDQKRFWSDLILNNALYILMAIFVIYTAIMRPNFRTLGSLANLITQVAAYLPLALGIAGCIVLTGTDLSAGRVVGLTAAVAGVFMQKSDFANKMFQNLPEISWWWIGLTLLAVIAIGALIGLVNGFFVAKFSLHPFIVTLSTQLIVYGLVLMFMMLGTNSGQTLSGMSDGYREFVAGELFKVGKTVVPNYVLYSLIITIVVWVIWNKTTFGKNMFAVGSNEEAANVSGVNVTKTIVLTFMLAGALYAITGFMDAARIASVNATTGLNYEADAIAACVIGGISFVGGIGKVSGAIIGVLLLQVIFVGLNFLSVDQNLLYIVKGGIILVACAIDMRKYLVRK